MSDMLTRRHILTTAAGVAASAAASGLAPSRATAADDAVWRVINGRIRQTVMGWCFNPMPTEELARGCKDIGLVAMEGIGANHYPMIRKLGLNVSLVGSHSFSKGPCDPANRDMCISKLNDAIDLAAEVECANVITFTGMRVKDLDNEAMDRNCVSVWKEVIAHAEKKKVNLCLEHLNSRDNTHPMKGHPGYYGDHVDHCVRLIKAVGSPNMKLLFDIYHVQIMDGDVIRRIGQLRDVTAHYHTAGVPGRAELDEKQELNYPAIMRAILDTGYTGYVAQEFIPTWPDKLAALRHAAKVCDV